MYQSPRLPRKAVLTQNLHHGRQDLSNLEARTSSVHQSKQSEEYGWTRCVEFEETRSGDIDFRIQGLPHSFKKKTMFAEKQSRNSSTNFETHPNRESLMADLNKNPKIQSVQRRVEGIDPQHRCARPLPSYNAQIVHHTGRLALCTVRAANACSLRKEIDSWTRRDTTSSNYVIKKRIKITS